MKYTHTVTRESGYVAGWFGGDTAEADAAAAAAECNRNVPGDPAHVEPLEGDEAWGDLAAEATTERP